MSGKDRATQVIPTAEDEEFTIWLGARFTGGDEYATRIQVCQWINNQRGDVVHTYDAKPDGVTDGKTGKGKPRLTREKLVEISHKIIAAAQADCDSLRRSTVYTVMAFHPAMGADSYSRHLLRLAPKTTLAVDANGVVNEDSIMSTKLLLGLLADEKRDKRWLMETAMNVVSGSAERDAARIEKMEAMLDGRLEKETKFIEATETALSRAAERKIKTDWAEIKVSGVRELLGGIKGLLGGGAVMLSAGKVGVEQAIRELMASLTRGQIAALVGGNLESPTGGVLTIEQAHILRRIDGGDTALIGALLGSLSPQQLDQMQKLLNANQLLLVRQLAVGFERATEQRARGATQTETETETPAVTPERAILDRFFSAVKAAPNASEIDTKLFGRWKKGDNGVAVNEAPGILSPEQFILLASVCKGDLRADALDDLIPGSGKPLALTDEQQAQARAIMPAAAVEAIMELFMARAQAREASGANGVGQN